MSFFGRYLTALDKEVLKEFSGLKFSFTKNIDFGLEVSLFFNKLFALYLRTIKICLELDFSLPRDLGRCPPNNQGVRCEIALVNYS